MLKCRGSVVQRSITGDYLGDCEGAEVLQRWCRGGGAEAAQILCRGGTEVHAEQVVRCL